MESEFIRSCRLIEQSLRDDEKRPPKLVVNEAILDCLLFLLEASDELGPKNSTFLLDVVADVMFAEVDNKPVPKKSLRTIIQIATTAKEALRKSDPSVFSLSGNAH